MQTNEMKCDREDVPKRRQEIISTPYVITQKSAGLMYFAAEAWNQVKYKTLTVLE